MRRSELEEFGRVFAATGSPAAPLARALSWLWRLGTVLDAPSPSLVAFGDETEAEELIGLVKQQRLAAAVVFVADPGPSRGVIPDRRAVNGVASFGTRFRVTGDFVVFAGGRDVVRSSVGIHAVRAGKVLIIGSGADVWGRLDRFWCFPAIARFLAEVLERPLVLLPPLGCIRLDDVPGTAQQQIEGRAKSDRKARRLVDAIVAWYGRADARLVVAVASRGLVGGESVPLDAVWPDATRALARGVSAGVLEPACHGTLHLDTKALAEGRVDPREFASLDFDEAARRLDLAVAWLGDHVGEPASFIAPSWGYSPGTLAAAAERGLLTWRPPQEGPLIAGSSFFETLRGAHFGLYRLDYGPLQTLASIGLPPILVFHGRSFDHRLQSLRLPNDLAAYARLALRRDVFRVARLPGVRWVGAGDLFARLQIHDSIAPRVDVNDLAATDAVLLHPGGARTRASAIAETRASRA